MTETDYYRRRERQERERAAQSQDVAVRTIHLDLANHYARMLRDPPVRGVPTLSLVRPSS